MFPSATKNQVQSMVGTIREAYRADFQALGWIDNSTRANAITKLDAMIDLIGYSTVDPNVGSAKALEKYYAAVHIKDSEYYSNVIQAKAQILKNMLARLGRSTERNRMDEDPHNAPEYLNFGALGMIAGHEISHGFDNFGRNYGPRGELHDYSKFTVTGPEGETLHVNSEQTLGENISDNGDIKMAFMAWAKRFVSDRDSRQYNNKLLPGRGVSHLAREQLFFLSFGQSWCRLGTPTYFANQVRDGVHTPNHERVLGTVQNSREFARAFKCKTDSPMNPVNKCEIW
ncbi:Peptidase M13 [Mortierella antarctica]|nr:Peptidase M13 [Mortierella antarctica]